MNSPIDLSSLFKMVPEIALEFGLNIKIVDFTDHTFNIRLFLDRDLFIQIYVNDSHNKINLVLVLRNKRLYGADGEGRRYHIHPAENPESHLFTEDQVSIKQFVLNSLKIVDERGLL